MQLSLSMKNKSYPFHRSYRSCESRPVWGAWHSSLSAYSWGAFLFKFK